jgi:hypothetical protein
LFEFALIKELNDYGINISKIRVIFDEVFKKWRNLDSQNIESFVKSTKPVLMLLKNDDGKIVPLISMTPDPNGFGDFIKEKSGIKSMDDLKNFKIGKTDIENPRMKFLPSTPDGGLFPETYVSFLWIDLLGLYSKIEAGS